MGRTEDKVYTAMLVTFIAVIFAMLVGFWVAILDGDDSQSDTAVCDGLISDIVTYGGTSESPTMEVGRMRAHVEYGGSMVLANVWFEVLGDKYMDSKIPPIVYKIEFVQDIATLAGGDDANP